MPRVHTLTTITAVSQHIQNVVEFECIPTSSVRCKICDHELYKVARAVGGKSYEIVWHWNLKEECREIWIFHCKLMRFQHLRQKVIFLSQMNLSVMQYGKLRWAHKQSVVDFIIFCQYVKNHRWFWCGMRDRNVTTGWKSILFPIEICLNCAHLTSIICHPAVAEEKFCVLFGKMFIVSRKISTTRWRQKSKNLANPSEIGWSGWAKKTSTKDQKTWRISCYGGEKSWDWKTRNLRRAAWEWVW